MGKDKRQRQILKMFLALLCLVVAVTILPSGIGAAKAAEDESSKTGEEIFKQVTGLGQPEDYSESDKKHPYGYGQEATSLFKNSRLMFAVSAERNDGDPSKDCWLLKGYKGGETIDYDGTKDQKVANWSQN